jgi:hypothetical protein
LRGEVARGSDLFIPTALAPEEKEIKFKWKDILGENPPEASFNRESYFCLDLVQYHEFIEEVLYRGPNSDKSKEAGSRNP